MTAVQATPRPEDAALITPFPQAVQKLVKLIGLRDTGIMLGARQSRTVRDWMSGTVPKGDTKAKALFALQIAGVVSANCSEDAVHGYMIGSNYRLRDEAPLILIRDSFESERLNILSAARSFMTNQG